LRLRGLERVLTSTRFHFVVSERTWVTSQERLSHSKLFASPSGTLFFKDGRPQFYEETAADKEQRNKKDEEFNELVEKTCDRRGAPLLAAVEPEKREALEKFFGAYGAESMLLASSPDSVLWTDDLIQAQTSAQEFGSRSVWTQIVLATLTETGLLTAEDYADATARFLGMEYVATQFDSSSLIAAFRLASWSGSKRPAAQALKTFADPNTDLRRLFQIFVEFAIRLYREPLTPETRCSVTDTFLEIFGQRTGGLILLTGLRRSSSALFGMNAVGRVQFDKCFDRWVQRRNQGGIVLPGS